MIKNKLMFVGQIFLSETEAYENLDIPKPTVDKFGNGKS